MIKNFLQLRINAGLWHDVMHHTSILNNSRQRAFTVGCGVAFLYLLLAIRLTDVMIIKTSTNHRTAAVGEFDPIRYKRQDILDCNGEVLATQIVTASVYAEPKNIINAREAAEKLATIFPEVGFATLHQRLKQANKSFIWVARHVTPKAQEMIYQLGIPGVHLQRDYRRVYPHGELCGHILGGCDIDGAGHSGMELYFNDALREMDSEKPLKISIDVRIQHMIADILSDSIKEFEAVGGNVILMRIPDGQIVSMVSLPSYDPNKPSQGSEIFNRNTMGVYEPGSAFKILNTAIAIESGKIKPGMLFDARFPVKIGKNTVSDFRGACTFLTLEQAFVKSSNIASIMMVRLFGAQFQQECFKRFGVFDTIELELPEKSPSLYPNKWTDVTAWTTSYGYGIAITPIRTLTTIATLINDGYPVKPTLIYTDTQKNKSYNNKTNLNNPVISASTSAKVRELMRMASIGKLADIEGMDIIGKSGTTYKRVGTRGYGANNSGHKPRIASFVGAFPQHRPQYIMYVALDDPKAQAHTHGFAAAGWNAVPTAGRIFKRIAGLLSIDMTHANKLTPTKACENPLPASSYVRETSYVR